MTAKRYIRINSVNYELVRFALKKQSGNAIDQTELELSKTNANNIKIGDDGSIGHIDGGSFVSEFNGDITKKEVYQTVKCVMESYGGRLNRVFASEIYEDKSPEYIANDLVTKYTSLTYSSTNTSGVIISKFVVNDETVASALKRLMDLLEWRIRVDNDKKFYFEPKGIIPSSVTLTINSNAVLTSKWKTVPNRLINSVVFIGDKATFNKLESFNAIASQTEFTLSYEPSGNVRVLVNDVEKVGGQEGSTTSYDYTVDAPNKKIIFESGLSLNDEVKVYYEYSIPIKIEAKEENSVSTYTEFPKKITNKNITNMSDARLYVSNIFKTYANPSYTAEILVAYDTDVDINESVYIIDSFNSVEGNFTVNKLTLKYPEGTKTILVGTPELNMLNWNTEVDKRLKALEQAKDNSNILQKFISVLNKMNLKITRKKIEVKYRTKGNSFIFDDPDSEFDDGVHLLDWQGSAWTQHYIDEVT